MSTQNSLPGKVKSYDGPTTHADIIRQIHKDARKRMPELYIERVIGLFFSTVGIGKHIKAGANFRIPQMGSFIISKKELRIRERARIIQAAKVKKAHAFKMRKYLRKLSNIKKWKEVNDYRESGGKAPFTFTEFMSITQRKR